MFNLTDDQKIQLLLVGGPIVSLIGTWMSLRTYGRLRQRGDRLAEEARQREEAEAAAGKEEAGEASGGNDADRAGQSGDRL